MISLFFKLFARNITGNKLYMALGLFGLVVGLSGSYILFLWVNHELSYDRFHDDSHLIYRIVREDYVEGDWVKNVFTPVPLAVELPERYSGIRAGTSIWSEGQHTFSNGDSRLIAGFHYCSENFFSVFDFPLIEKAGADLFPYPNSAVISKDFAMKMFGSTNCLEKELTRHFYGKTSYYISAVVDIPENSHFGFDVLVPYTSSWGYKNAAVEWGFSAANYIKLDKKVALDHAQIEEMKSLLQNQPNPHIRMDFQPLHDIYLFTDFDDGFSTRKSSHTFVRLISVIGYALLALSVINYIMLFTSRSEARGKEMAIKKLMGVSRAQLVGQYSLEILVVTSFALFLSFVLVRFVLPFVNSLSGKTLLLIPGWNSGLYIIITGISVSLLSASYIAFYLSRFSPLDLLRGKSDFSPRFRINNLVATLQLAFAIGFVIFSLSLLAQFRFMSNKEKGLETKNILTMPTRAFGYNYISVKNRLLSHSNILDVTAGGPPPVDYQFSPVQQIRWEGMELPTDLNVTVMAVDPDYLETLKIELAEGEFLPQDMSIEKYFAGHYRERTPVIINERFKSLMGVENPIGKTLYMSRFDANGIITGVVKDFHFRPLTNNIEPLIMFYDPEDFSYMYIRIGEGDLTSTMEYISRIANEVKKGEDVVNTFFLEDAIQAQFKEQSAINQFVFAATIATIFLAIMGMLGMISYKMVRDKKNITIRKIYGADSGSLRFLYVRKILMLFLYGYLPALIISWYVVHRWLSGFAYIYNPFSLIALIVLLAGLVMSALLVVLSVNKTCSINPADLIRKL